MNYLSRTSFDIVTKIKELEAETYKKPTAVIVSFILFLVSFITLIACLIFMNHVAIYIPIIALILSIFFTILIVFFGVKYNKELGKKDLNEEFINKLIKLLEEKNLYSIDKVDMLINEINNSIEYHDQKYNSLMNRCFKLFRNIFWIPLGVLLGTIIGLDAGNIKIENYETIISFLLVIALYFIAFTIMLYPIDLRYVFHPEKMKKEDAIRGIFDIKYRLK